jgi:hypothetical protein
MWGGVFAVTVVCGAAGTSICARRFMDLHDLPYRGLLRSMDVTKSSTETLVIAFCLFEWMAVDCETGHMATLNATW